MSIRHQLHLTSDYLVACYDALVQYTSKTIIAKWWPQSRRNCLGQQWVGKLQGALQEIDTVRLHHPIFEEICVCPAREQSHQLATTLTHVGAYKLLQDCCNPPTPRSVVCAHAARRIDKDCLPFQLDPY